MAIFLWLSNVAQSMGDNSKFNYKYFNSYPWNSENEILSNKSGKMTAGPIKTLGFQDRLSGIALSFDFVNFGYYN